MPALRRVRLRRAFSPDFGSAATGTGTLRVDSIASVGTKLTQLLVPGVTNGQLCYVGNDTFPLQPSVHRFYAARVGQALTADGIEVVNSTVMAGVQWVDLGTTQPGYQIQDFWAVDPADVSGLASDENKGYGSSLTDAQGAPLATFAELARRLAAIDITGRLVKISYMSASLVPFVEPCGARSESTSQQGGSIDAGAFVLIGQETVLRTGHTLTAGTAAVTTNAALQLEDTTLPAGGWAVGGTGSSSCITDGTGTRLIRTLDKANHAILVYQELANPKRALAQDPAVASPAANQNIPNTPSAAFVSGAAYEVISLPALPGGEYTLPVWTYYIDYRDTTGSVLVYPIELASTCGTRVILGGIFGCVVKGTVNEAVCVHYGNSCNFDPTLFVGCGVLGNAVVGDLGTVQEFWQGCHITNLSPMFQLTAAFLTVHDDVLFERGSGNQNWRFTECCAGYHLQFWAPCVPQFDLIAGQNHITQDQPIEILSAEVHLQFPEASIAGTVVINLYGGYLGRVKNNFFFIGPAAAGAEPGDWNDLNTRTSLVVNSVFA